MKDTVIGVFDEYDEALRAQQELVDAGIDAASIQLTPPRSGDDTAENPPQVDHRSFFARMFGLHEDDEKPGNYAEAVRRGSTAVTVSLEDDSRAEEVTDILHTCGAIDVDERAEYWKASGFTAFDPSAQPYSGEEIKREREAFRTQSGRLNARYTGPERRTSSSRSYNGPERRMGL